MALSSDAKIVHSLRMSGQVSLCPSHPSTTRLSPFSDTLGLLAIRDSRETITLLPPADSLIQAKRALGTPSQRTAIAFRQLP